MQTFKLVFAIDSLFDGFLIGFGICIRDNEDEDEDDASLPADTEDRLNFELDRWSFTISMRAIAPTNPNSFSYTS